MSRGRAVVEGEGGWRATVLDSGPSGVLLKLSSGEELLVPPDALIPQGDGRYYVPLQLDTIAQPSGRSPDGATVVPVIVEEARVDKRVIETGRVRVSKEVHDHVEVVDVPLMREEIDIQRVAVGRPVNGPISVRYEGETVIIPLVEEMLVVEKRLVLKEELHITKRRTEHHAPQRVTLREERARVERVQQREREGES